MRNQGKSLRQTMMIRELLSRGHSFVLCWRGKMIIWDSESCEVRTESYPPPQEDFGTAIFQPGWVMEKFS